MVIFQVYLFLVQLSTVNSVNWDWLPAKVNLRTWLCRGSQHHRWWNRLSKMVWHDATWPQVHPCGRSHLLSEPFWRFPISGMVLHSWSWTRATKLFGSFLLHIKGPWNVFGQQFKGWRDRKLHLCLSEKRKSSSFIHIMHCLYGQSLEPNSRRINFSAIRWSKEWTMADGSDIFWGYLHTVLAQDWRFQMVFSPA